MLTCAVLCHAWALLLLDRSAAIYTGQIVCGDAKSGAALAEAYDVLADHGMTSDAPEQVMPCPVNSHHVFRRRLVFIPCTIANKSTRVCVN